MKKIIKLNHKKKNIFFLFEEKLNKTSKKKK